MMSYFRVSAAVPLIKLADVSFNKTTILNTIKSCKSIGTQFLIFPELCLTGSTCGELFKQHILISKALAELAEILKATEKLDISFVIGSPLSICGSVYNCAIYCFKGKILSVVPKVNLDKTEHFFFKSGKEINNLTIDLLGQKVPFCTDLVFHTNENLNIMVRFYSDLNTFDTKANLVLVVNAAKACVLQDEQITNYIKALSNHNHIAYVYSSSGLYESSTDFSHSGLNFICENGEILASGKTYVIEDQLTTSDIDLDLLHTPNFNPNLQDIQISPLKPKNILRKIQKNPFIPDDLNTAASICAEILNIQKTALATRMKAISSKNLVIGISGGLDSTLALLSAILTKDFLKEDRKEILGITMPGYGTSNATYNNAKRLLELTNISHKEISIVGACDLHFKDIDYDKSIKDTTFENAQARERTQILFDIANTLNALVLGTGDFTELALGFATYNGDHMSSYGLNANIPKTVVARLIQHIIQTKYFSHEINNILQQVLDTPISPELLPPDLNGEISQKTEDIVGPYEINDFYLYYVLKHGFCKDKVLFLAANAFGDKYTEQFLENVFDNFMRRFIQQQFKRSCSPDGPAVFDFSFSPRGGYLIPSDASYTVFTN